MNVKLPFVFLAIALVVMASGCVQDKDSGTTGPADDGGDQEQLDAQQQGVMDDLESDLVDESEEIDTGEMI